MEYHIILLKFYNIFLSLGRMDTEGGGHGQQRSALLGSLETERQVLWDYGITRSEGR